MLFFGGRSGAVPEDSPWSPGGEPYLCSIPGLTHRGTIHHLEPQLESRRDCTWPGSGSNPSPGADTKVLTDWARQGWVCTRSQSHSRQNFLVCSKFKFWLSGTKWCSLVTLHIHWCPGLPSSPPPPPQESKPFPRHDQNCHMTTSDLHVVLCATSYSNSS